MHTVWVLWLWRELEHICHWRGDNLAHDDDEDDDDYDDDDDDDYEDVYRSVWTSV